MVDSSNKTRETKSLRALTVNRLGGSRVPVYIDPQIGRTSGPNHAQFVGYLGVLSHKGFYFASRLGSCD